MSFLTSLGQYVAGVADSVAGLALSPRRVPPSRHRSAEESQAHPPPPSTATMRGFPRVVPTEGAAALNARRRTLDCLAPAPPPRRGGSLRVPRNQQPPEKPTMAFCKRRLSWPEVDNSVNSGVQDTDGSYFENFTALSWRHENRRLAALRLVEARSERAPPAPHDLGLPSVSAQLSHKEHEHLYTEVLYCIENAVGAPAPDGQFAAYKEEVVEHARRAFRVSAEVHARAMRSAGSERPPTVVLGCSVIEADGLEAKDANGATLYHLGFSDPYCMLGIQPASLPASPRASEDEGRKHGFRLSFKRREGRQQRDSLGRLPARYIRATSVRQHTLSPKWNETFKFDIDDISSDVLHLDIWDHDDESSVLDAVSRLNEVRGVRGLGRFFKQVCQSARQGSQDDFLGCVNIPLREIPSTGKEAWYKLEARSQRSSVQGRIRLRLWLSAREAGRHDDDNWQQVRQHERLFGVLLAHEVDLQRAAAESSANAAAAAAAAGHPVPSAATPTPPWDGDLCGAAQTLLHQHAIQGDLSALQASIARFAAACRLNADAPLDPKYMHKLLIELERAWCACEAISGSGSGDSGSGASRDEERWLADCFAEYVDRALHQLRLHRDLYPVLHQYSINKLEYLLRCLSQLSQMKAFWRCCPFNKEIRSEIVSALRKGTSEWYEALCGQDTNSERGEDLVNLITLIQIDLQQGLTYYHPLFEMTNNVPYFSIVFNQIDKMLSEDVRQCVEHWVVEGWCGVVEEPMYDEHGNGDAKIDAVALGLLKENDITSLIPIIGDRVKFDANLSMWKADNQSVNVGDSSQLSDLVSDGNFSGIIYELQGTDQNEVETFVVQAEQTPHPDRDKIRSILNNTHRGRALLNSPQAVSGLLDSSQRKELAHFLLDSVLEAHPNTQLKWSDFQSWARGIGELFKKESPVIYYAAYIAGGPFQAKRNASGILYNTYLRKRKNLIKRNVTKPFRKRRATSDSSDLSDVEPARPMCPLTDLSIIDEICLVTIAKTLPFEVLSAVRELCAAASLAPQPQTHPHAPHDPPPQLLDCYLWFEPLIDRWLAVTKTMALQRVRAAVELDRPVEGEHLVKHSTSSVDTAACLYHMRLVWRSVGGAEECTAGGSVRLLEAACATALHYADLVHGALADQGYYENHGQNKTTEEICTIVNNLEYVRRSLAEYDDEHILNEENARQLVRGALGTLDARAIRAAAPLAARARPPLRKAVFHLAWSPDTLPTTQAITPLLEFLDQHLSSLNTWLLPRAFIRALAGCWSGVLKEVSSQADAGGAERPRVYHHRLREALDLLAEFFHAEGKGLPMSEVHNAEWFRVEQRMEYHQAPTEKLLELWLADRLAEQARTPLPSRYGSILVRVYFNHDSLCVEVLSARDVIPLDPNGLSDPFVVLELVPKRLFPKAHEQTTNVQKKTLNPIWDECFEFGVSLEACRCPGAALALSVWDRDVLTADDFAGEAFVSLARVPGVNCHAPPDPLRPIELPLMQLHDRNHPILQILESRTTDKLAIDFVKKQKLRFAEQ